MRGKLNIRKFSPSILLTAAFVVSIFLLFFIASISFKQSRSLSNSQQAITRSLHIRIELEKLFSELKDAESAHRGYLLSKDKRYLQPYNYSQVNINKMLIDIQKSALQDEMRLHEFDVLNNLINQRFKEFRQSLNNSRRVTINSDSFKEDMWRGKLIMDRIRGQINRIAVIEDQILANQQLAHTSEITFTPMTSLFIVIFALIIFALTFITLKRNLRQMRILNQRLSMVNDTFTYAERIGEICHWHYDLASDIVTFSENRWNLLGAQPGSPETNVRNYLKFVHISDRKKVANCFKREKNIQPLLVYYKVVRADRKIRYFKTISKLILDNKGREIVIGIDCDVTLQQRSTMKLEQKNRELINSNAELSSFNHIVSHDLQEPMRKIQMFVSRIAPDEISKLSDASKAILGRIHSSAQRAQNLIDDLLLYSGLNRQDRKPELTDLNELLENAKSDLAESIDEKNAEIFSDRLPSIKVVAYQIQQLIVNLISNSIKYSKADEPPRITISYSIVSSKEIEHLRKTHPRKYHQFEFTDNGIGFEPEYEKRIFVLFHRLHDKDAYSGTGIGLAICKKMAENHDGFLLAKGNPGTGASFTLYLPL